MSLARGWPGGRLEGCLHGCTRRGDRRCDRRWEPPKLLIFHSCRSEAVGKPPSENDTSFHAIAGGRGLVYAGGRVRRRGTCTGMARERIRWPLVVERARQIALLPRYWCAVW